jgi:tetratricopeptide (TPR) repeat protein
MNHHTRLNRAWKVGLVLGLMWATGCSSSTPPPQSATSPEPQSEPSQGEAAPASNSRVKDAIDAIKAQDYAKAKELLTAARAQDPKDVQAAYYLGVAEQGLGKPAEAIQPYRDALGLDPKLTEASINLSAALLDVGGADNAAAAADVAKEGLKTAPNSADLLLNLAVALAMNGNFAEAAQTYAKLVAKSPGDLKLKLEYARVLGKAGEKDKAISELEQVGRTDDPVLLTAAANLRGQLADYRGCVAALDKVIQKKPTAEPYVRRGACKKETGDNAGAQADYEQAIKLDAQYAPAYLYLGRHLYFVAKKNKEAIATLEKAQRLGAGTPIAREAEQTLATIRRGKK